MFEPVDLLQGTLDVLILKALSLEPNHGLGVAKRVEQMTADTFRVKPGSLFPALHRLEEQGWVKSEWGESANKRRAKFYKLTRSGRSQLQMETDNWKRIAFAITRSLELTA